MKDSEATAIETVDPPPPGFVALPLGSPGCFMRMTGPFYAKREGEGFVFGFRVEPRHCFLPNLCHGGMLVTFADQSIPLAVNVVTQRTYIVTVSLSADFLAAAQLGEWLEARVQTFRETKSMVFSQCVVSSDGGFKLRASSVMKLGPPIEPGKRTFDLEAITSQRQ